MTMQFCGTIAAETPQELLAQFEGMVQTNQAWLAHHPEAPLLYESGVVYRREGSPELWFDIAGILAHGYDDCEGLACWRAAELRRMGYAARVVLRPYLKADGGRLFHALVEVDTPDGFQYDDPSARLGMLRNDAQVSGLSLTRKGVARDSADRATCHKEALVGDARGTWQWSDAQKFGGVMVPRRPRLLIRRRDGSLADAETLPETGTVDLNVEGIGLRISVINQPEATEAGVVTPLLLMAAKGAARALTSAPGSSPPTSLPPPPPGMMWVQTPVPTSVSGLGDGGGPPPVLQALRRLLPRANAGHTWNLVPIPAGQPAPPPVALPVPVAAPVAAPRPAPPPTSSSVLVPGATALRRGVDAVGDIITPSNRVNLLIDTTGATYDARDSRRLPRTFHPEEP